VKAAIAVVSDCQPDEDLRHRRGVGLIPQHPAPPQRPGAAGLDSGSLSVRCAQKRDLPLPGQSRGLPGEDHDRQLKACTDRARQQAADLLRYSVDMQPAQRALPDVCDFGSYLRIRVGGQIDGYYQPRARQLRARLKRFRRVEFVLAVVGVALGVLAPACRSGAGAPESR
jgi:hypothetical protein